MSNTLSVKLASRKSGEASWFEGTVSICGLKPTKLARRSDGSTQFPTKSAVSGAARNLAKSLGFADVDVADSSVAPKAAKKSATPKTASKKSATATPKTASKKSATSAKSASKKSATKSKSASSASKTVASQQTV